MSPHHTRYTRGIGVLCGLGVLLLVGPALGSTANKVGGGVDQSPLFKASPDNKLVLAGPLWNGSVTFPSMTTWKIAPTWQAEAGLFEWSATLDQDLNPGGPLAAGQFLPGGTLRISGRLYDGYTLLYDGLLLEANWVSGFKLLEDSQNTNRMDTFPVADMTSVAVRISGGWLWENNYLAPWYGLSYKAVGCRQNGGDLIDFQSDITTLSMSDFSLVPIPEPSAAWLLVVAGGSLFMTRRRK